MEKIDVARPLLRPLKDFPELYRPNFRRNVYHVLSTVFDMIGAETGRRTLFDDKRYGKVLEDNECKGAENVVLVLVDSCGIQQFALSRRFTRLFRELGSLLLSSVFPTTTSSVMASIACGVPPNDHGILGHNIYIDEVGAVVDTLRASVIDRAKDSLHYAGVNLRKLLWSKSLFSDLGEDVTYVELLQWGIARTGLSHFLGVERETLGFANLIDAFSMAKRLLGELRGQKLIVQLYVHILDSISHKYGPYSKEYRLGLRFVEQSIIRFARSLRGRIGDETTLMVISDHGQDMIDPLKRVELTREEAEAIGQYFSSKPGTSGRVRHFYVAEEYVDEFETAMRERIDGRAALLSFEEVRESLLERRGGRERIRLRMGDYVLIPLPGCEVRVKREEEAKPLLKEEYVGSHGSLTVNELIVPLLAARIPLIKKALG